MTPVLSFIISETHELRLLSMNARVVLLELVNGYKTYSAAILTIVTGVGAILSKNYSQGATDILQALALIFGGASVVGLRHAVANVPPGASGSA
jgi:hypothetical protein